MGRSSGKEGGWFPLRGSWEEAVLSWNEQIEKSFRQRELKATRRAMEARPAEKRPEDRQRA